MSCITKEGWLVVTSWPRVPVSSHTGSDNNSPAPHEARYRDPDQLCVAAPACWQCAPLSPRGLHTDAAFLILIMSAPAHYAPTPRWGRWLGAFKYSVAGGEKQREWNVDNAVGIWGSQAKLKGIQGDSGSSTGFYFMWLLLGWPSQSQVKQKLRLPRGHLARCIVKYHL